MMSSYQNSGFHSSTFSSETFQDLTAPFEISNWNITHPKEKGDYDRYRDMLSYKQPIDAVVERLPMVLRLEGEQTSLEPGVKRAMRKACTEWKGTQVFYGETEQAILALSNKNAGYFDDNQVGRHKAVCCALRNFESELHTAHKALSLTIANLFKAGYTYSAIMPMRERRLYRKTG